MTLNVFKLNLLGQWRGAIPIPSATSLEESEENLDGSSKKAFLQFMRKMLQWQPEHRQTAKQLLKDPWLNGVATIKPLSEQGSHLKVLLILRDSVRTIFL